MESDLRMSFPSTFDVQYNRRNGDLELIQKDVERMGATTFQYQVPGLQPIVTIDPENIKAILVTPYNFGKGEEFRGAFKMVCYVLYPTNPVSWRRNIQR